MVTPAATAGGAFPSKPMKPFFDLWVAAGGAMDPGWAGRWEPWLSTGHDSNSWLSLLARKGGNASATAAAPSPTIAEPMKSHE